MPNTRTFLKSFSGGEISPEMAGRIDDKKYQHETYQNVFKTFLARPEGFEPPTHGLENRCSIQLS